MDPLASDGFAPLLQFTECACGVTKVSAEMGHRVDPFAFVEAQSREHKQRVEGEMALFLSNLSPGPIHSR